MGTPSERLEPPQPEPEPSSSRSRGGEAKSYAPQPSALKSAAPSRRAYGEAYESLTFTVLTNARRELTVTLAAQPVFDLARSVPVARRVRRTVRHLGGERALLGIGRRPVEPMDLHRIDLLTLRQGLDMLRMGPSDSGVVPAYWRTIASSRGRFALLCAELQHARAPGALMVEVTGGLEHAPTDAIGEAIRHFETSAQAVILHIAPDPAAARRLLGAGARCLAIDFAGVEHEHARHWSAAAELIGTAREACGQVLVLNLRPDRGTAAQAAGATHAVFAGMEPISV